ncbi:hypothetical protein CAOG_007646 [Capsaspora owczarzaki ATCC 30864]|uniref:Uncharacterized protein n=2 Tax=Capsaspora owczarzaki (strain ATCC 30864) TaxID=595528 RepID=A0A0D2UQC5_CAPO3|nr:hypothetical protein CAOG_007646 [Capsaspora owczarzaki ATCC 30864]
MPAAAAAVGASSTLQQPPSNPALPSSPLPQPNTRSQMLASPTPLDIQAASASAAAALSSASATASTNSPNVSGGADGYAGGATATDGTATSSNALAALTAAASAAAPPSPPTSMPSNYPGWQMASGAAGLSAGGSSGSGLAAVSASSQQGVPQQPLTQQLPRISLAEDPDQAGHIGPLLLFEQSRAFASSLQGTSATIVTHLLESSSLVSLANRAIMEQLSQLHGQQAGSAVVTGTLGAGASEGGSLLEGASTSLAQLISSDHAGQLVAPLQPLEQLDGNILPSMQTAALLSAIGADSIPCSFEERRSFDLYRLACIVCELYLADRYHARGILEATGPSRLRTSATVDALSELDPVLGVTAPASKQRANNLSNAATISPFDTALPSFSPFPVRHTIPTAPGTTSFISQVNLAARNSVMLLNEVVFNSAVPQSLTQPIGSAEGSAANSDQTAVRQRLAAQRHAVSTKLVAAPSSAGLLAPSLVGMSSSAGSSSVNATSNQIASMSMGGGFSAAFNTSVSGMPSGKGATAFATAAASAQAAASSTLSATANTSSGTAAGSLPGATSSAAASMMMGSQGPASLYLPYLNELPSTVRQAVALLLRNDSSITPPTDLLLQTSFLPGGSFLFPDYFPALYSFLAEFQASDWPTRVTFTAEHITTLVKLADDGFQIAMPFIMQLFSHPLTRQQAAVLLFDHVTAKLGPRRTRVVFLKPLLALFELTADEAVQVVILSKRFVLSLLNRIGLSFFMEHFVGFLIDGVVSANIAIAKAAGDGLVDLAAQLGPVIPSRFMTKPLLRHLTRPNANIVIKCLLSISATGGETVVLGQYIPHIISTLAAQLTKAATIAAPSPTAAATASLGNEAGNVSGVSSTSSLVEMSLGSALAAANATIADVASPTSMADRSAQTIVNVLNLLQGCCEHLNSDTLAEQMDDFSSKVFMPLIRWLGSPSSAAFSGALRSRMCRQMLESMIYVCRLLSRKCADAMPIMKDFALPILRVFFAPFDWIYDRTLEDTTGHPRTSSASDALTSASFIAAQRASAAPNGESDLEEWRQVYTAETAYLAYSQFCLLVGQESMRRYIANSQLIETLMYSHLASFSHSGNEMDGNAEQGPGSVVSASAISAAIAAAVSAAAAAPMPPQSANDSMRAKFSNLLTLGSKKDGDDPSAEEIQTTYANWGTYLTHQMNPQSRNASLSFRELKLQSFAGHTAAVRSLAVFDNEQQFVSGSKDKTVKLWSIGMEEDSLPVAKCRRTYVGHRKTVSSVQIMTSTDFVASCDGGIHIWNPENGYCTQQFDLPKSSIVCFQQIPQRSCLVAGTSDNTLRFLDLESNQLLHEWKVATMPAGSIRSIAVDPGYNWIATGFSGGIISLLDLRTGLMLAAWRAHESDVLSMKPVSEHQLVSSSADSTLTLWNVHTAVPVKFMRGHTDAVTHFEISKRDVLALTASNRLGFHGALDRTQPSFTSHKLRSDAIRGTVNSFAMLPVNQQLLFGADSGMISLWA